MLSSYVILFLSFFLTNKTDFKVISSKNSIRNPSWTLFMQHTKKSWKQYAFQVIIIITGATHTFGTPNMQ